MLISTTTLQDIASKETITHEASLLKARIKAQLASLNIDYCPASNALDYAAWFNNTPPSMLVTFSVLLREEAAEDFDIVKTFNLPEEQLIFLRSQEVSPALDFLEEGSYDKIFKVKLRCYYNGIDKNTCRYKTKELQKSKYLLKKLDK